jgi:hypothetical protein
MFSSFEIKSYQQLNFALGIINAICFAAGVLVAYFFVLTPQHVVIIDKLILEASNKKIISGISVSAVLLLWGWIATILLRFHDRIHEPHIRKWRAVYDTDFILRKLLAGIDGGISPELFRRAYNNRKDRDKILQRVFYNFIGDETDIVAGRRLFFYTKMWQYWSAAIFDFYITVFLILYAIYEICVARMFNPWLVLICMCLITLSRIFSNRCLDEAHAITEDQIDAIKDKKAHELRTAAISVATDMGL